MLNKVRNLEGFDVVWPCGERRLRFTPAAKRLDTLNGKTIAQLWDHLRVARPWIDVVVALDAPGWVTDVLAKRINQQDGVWTQITCGWRKP